jgi:hypothetical protein
MTDYNDIIEEKIQSGIYGVSYPVTRAHHIAELTDNTIWDKSIKLKPTDVDIGNARNAFGYQMTMLTNKHPKFKAKGIISNHSSYAEHDEKELQESVDMIYKKQTVYGVLTPKFQPTEVTYGEKNLDRLPNSLRLLYWKIAVEGGSRTSLHIEDNTKLGANLINTFNSREELDKSIIYCGGRIKGKFDQVVLFHDNTQLAVPYPFVKENTAKIIGGRQGDGNNIIVDIKYKIEDDNTFNISKYYVDTINMVNNVPYRDILDYNGSTISIIFNGYKPNGTMILPLVNKILDYNVKKNNTNPMISII